MLRCRRCRSAPGSRCVVVDHLGNPADIGRHHCRRAGHRLQVHDPERLVHRRAYENGCCSEGFRGSSNRRGISCTQNTRCGPATVARPRRRPRRRSPACLARPRTAPAGRPGRTGGPPPPDARPFLAGDAADERHDRRPGSTPEPGQYRIARIRSHGCHPPVSISCLTTCTRAGSSAGTPAAHPRAWR